MVMKVQEGNVKAKKVGGTLDPARSGGPSQ